MKNTFLILAASAAILSTASGCAKCYVCTDKDKDEGTFEKYEYCDKDFDKGDIDDRIRDLEDEGYKCSAKSRVI